MDKSICDFKLDELKCGLPMGHGGAPDGKLPPIAKREFICGSKFHNEAYCIRPRGHQLTDELCKGAGKEWRTDWLDSTPAAGSAEAKVFDEFRAALAVRAEATQPHEELINRITPENLHPLYESSKKQR